METIHKYRIRCSGYAEPQCLLLPEGAEILSVAAMPIKGKDVEGLFLWAKVETDNRETERSIVVCGTGQPFALYKGHLKFISTFCMDPERRGQVGHAFELQPAQDPTPAAPPPAKAELGVSAPEGIR